MTITFSKLGMHGRLGNQMWQIASTIGIARRNVTGFLFPSWYYSRFFRNEIPYGKIDEPWKLYNETTNYYLDVNLENKYNWDLFGYFQSYRYFEHCSDEVRYYFDFKDQESINAVSIHVRRGDYLFHKEVHPIMSLDYYRRALKHFDGIDTLFIFSDDITWCKRYFKGELFDHRNLIFDVASPDIVSMQQMSMCKHNIISNSSFSWWAAYLNPNPDKIVISPNIWTYLPDDNIEDRIPREWIKLEI